MGKTFNLGVNRKRVEPCFLVRSYQSPKDVLKSPQNASQAPYSSVSGLRKSPANAFKGYSVLLGLFAALVLEWALDGIKTAWKGFQAECSSTNRC